MSFTAIPPITGTIETVTGLSPNTSYDFEIIAENSAGNSLPSAIISATTTTASSAPSAPTNLATSSVGTTTVNLSWTASTGTGPITYQVQKSPTGANTWTNGPNVSVTNAQVTGLTPSTGYDFLVFATNSVGSSVNSAILSNVVTLASATTVTWQTSGTTTIALSNTNLTATAGGNTTPYGQEQGCLSSLANGTGSYWFEIELSSITQNCSMGLAGSAFVPGSAPGGDNGNSIAFYPSTGTGSQPAQTVYYGGAQVLTPSGNAPAADVGGAIFTFLVNIDTSTGSGTFFVTGPSMQAAYGAGVYNDNSTADPATNVGGIPFTIAGNLSILFETSEGGGVAILNAGSSTASRTIPSNYTAWSGVIITVVAPTAPTSLTVGTVTSNTVDLSWTAPATGTLPLTYTIQQSPSGANTWTTSIVTMNSTTSATVTGLASSTAYDFRVTASNSAGTSAASGTASATTLNPSVLPGPPSGVSATANSTTQITVTWQAPTTGGTVGGTSGGYQLLYRKTGTNNFATFVSIPVITPGNGSFSALGGTWSVSTGGVIAFTGAGGPGTSSGVTQVTLVNGTVWQFNGTNWYGTTTPGSWPLGGTPTVPWSGAVTGLTINTSYDFEITASNPSGTGPASSPIVTALTLAQSSSGLFTISGGKIVLNNSPWICRGVCNYAFNDPTGGGAVRDHSTIAGVIPGINTFKACIGGGSIPTYSDLSSMITDWTTNNKCVVIIANYLYGAQYPINSGLFLTDAQLMAGVANNTILNPYVFFESENEPAAGDHDGEHVNHYNAVRQLVNFTGTASGNNLTVSNVSSPAWNPGATIKTGMTINPIAGSGAVPLHTTIVSQTSGTTGGAGVYVTSNATTASGTSMSAGNGNIVLFCSPYGNPYWPNGQPNGQMSASTYANMYNIVWDDHMYGTGNGVNSTGANDTLNTQGNSAAPSQGWGQPNSLAVRIGGFSFASSLDGRIPVGSFEWGDAAAGYDHFNYGDSTGGPGTYEHENIASMKAVCNAGVGNGIAGWAGQTAWLYGNYGRPFLGESGTGNADVLVDGGHIFVYSGHYGEIIAYCCANPNTRNTGTYGYPGGPS